MLNSHTHSASSKRKIQKIFQYSGKNEVSLSGTVIVVRNNMPSISIFHEDYSSGQCTISCMNFSNDIVIHWRSSSPVSAIETILSSIMTSNASADVIILTDIYCDEYHAPCGCTGYDGVCDYHHGCDDGPDFAPCLCSRKYDIQCEYHKR